MKGITKAIAFKQISAFLLCSKLLLIKEDEVIIKVISMRLIMIIKGKIDVNSFLELCLSSEISLAKAIGIPNCERLIRRLNVGIINVYKLIPLVPIILVVMIFIMIPRTLVIKPPVIRIEADQTNVFFMINFMKILKKIYHILKMYVIILLSKIFVDLTNYYYLFFVN